MLKVMNKKQKTTTNKGFSLVELIVVIAIMAVLVVVLAPAMLRYVENSRKSNDSQAVAGVVSTVQAAIIDDAIGAGTYTITIPGGDNTSCSVTAAANSDTNGVNAITAALVDAYGANWATDIDLESNTWGTANHNVSVAFTITNSGATTIAYNSVQANGDETFAHYIDAEPNNNNNNNNNNN